MALQVQHYGNSTTKGKLENYITSLSYPSKTETSTTRTVVKRGLEATSLAIVAGARGGMVMNCLTGASTIFDQPVKSPLGLSFGLGSGAAVVVNLGAMSAFTMLKIIDEITRNRSEEENALNQDDISTCKRVGLAIFSVLGGLVAQVPLAYATYKSALVAPWPFAIFQLLDCGRTAYSINESVTNIFKKKNNTEEPIEKQIERCKDVLINRIQNFRRALADENADKDKLLGKMNLCSKVDGYDEESPLVATELTPDLFIESLITEDIPQITPPPSLNTTTGKALDALSFLMASVVLSKFWMLGGQATNELISSLEGNTTRTSTIDNVTEVTNEGMTTGQKDTIYYTAAVLVTLANAYVWITLIKKATRFVADLLRNAVPATITKTLHGRVHNVITYTGSFLSCLLFIPQFYFAMLAFPNQPRYYYPVGAVSTIGTALGGIGATFALRDLLLARFTNSRKGKALLKLDSDLQKLLGFLSKVSIQDFAVFLSNLNEASKGLLSSPTRDEIAEYMNRRDLSAN